MDNSELEKDLLKACQANNIKATKEALLHINDVNFFDHLGNSPLWYCVIDNHFEILDLLIIPIDLVINITGSIVRLKAVPNDNNSANVRLLLNN